MEKMTKRNIYTALVNFAITGETPAYENANGEMITVSADALRTFAEKEIELIDKKNAKAKERAAAKKSEADELTKIVASVLTDEFEPIADIAARVEYEGVTLSKVTYRLTQLVKAGEAEKQDIKVTDEATGKTRTVKGYRFMVADAE